MKQCVGERRTIHLGRHVASPFYSGRTTKPAPPRTEAATPPPPPLRGTTTAGIGYGYGDGYVDGDEEDDDERRTTTGRPMAARGRYGPPVRPGDFFAVSLE